jgi:hypothetical protein
VPLTVEWPGGEVRVGFSSRPSVFADDNGPVGSVLMIITTSEQFSESDQQ